MLALQRSPAAVRTHPLRESSATLSQAGLEVFSGDFHGIEDVGRRCPFGAGLAHSELSGRSMQRPLHHPLPKDPAYQRRPRQQRLVHLDEWREAEPSAMMSLVVRLLLGNCRPQLLHEVVDDRGHGIGSTTTAPAQGEVVISDCARFGLGREPPDEHVEQVADLTASGGPALRFGGNRRFRLSLGVVHIPVHEVSMGIRGKGERRNCAAKPVTRPADGPTGKGVAEEKRRYRSAASRAMELIDQSAGSSRAPVYITTQGYIL